MDQHDEIKSTWIKAIEAAEERASHRIRQNRIRIIDYSVSLPKSLRDRIAKIMPYDYMETDENVFIEDYVHLFTTANVDKEDDSEEDKPTVVKDDEDFNESTCSEIKMLDATHLDCELKLEAQVAHELRKEKEINWMTKYICKPRKERVIWPTKVYNLKAQQKTLDEQAQELMDVTAERFTVWMNSLGSDPEDNMSKETLKALFNIEGDKKLFASIQNDPKEVKAIAQTVADKWNLPEMALELKYELYISERLKNLPKKIIKVAFGRCLPTNQIPWLPAERDGLIETIFPQDILTGEKLFKGIGHLGSVKAMADFYRKHPQLEKPKYMVKSGFFKKTKDVVTTADVPLYERLKLKY